MQIFIKEWVEYEFNPIALVSTVISRQSLFCNAIANAQCERNLKVKANANAASANSIGS